MTAVFANNAATTLAAPLTASATVVVIAPATAAKFPSLAAGRWHPLTIVDAAGGLEVVRVTARDANALTVVRGQEGTTARAFATGARAEIRLTAGVLTSMSDALTGAEADIDTLQSDATSLKSRATALDGRATTLETGVNSLKTRATALESGSTALGARATALESTASSHGGRISALETSATSLAGRATNVEGRATSLEGRASALENATGALDDDLTALIAQILPVGFGPAPWSLPTEPPGWIFADGRTLLANTPYSALRAVYIAASFPYGKDASNNPKIPDMRGRAPAGVDGGAGRLTGATLGAALGAQNHALTTAQMPSHTHAITDPGHAHAITDPAHSHAVSDPTHAHSVYDPGHAHSYTYTNPHPNFGYPGTAFDGFAGQSGQATSQSGSNIAIYGAATGISLYNNGTGVTVNGAATGVTVQANGSGTAHPIVQPTQVVNFIIKT